MEAAEKTAASIKDKTSEAVIKWMTETRSKIKMAAKSSRIKTLFPVTLYRGGEFRKSGEMVKQQRAQGGCLGTESRRKT